MMDLFIYLLRAGGYMALFYTAYYLFFRKETFYRHNRWLLLGAMAASMLLPLVQLPVRSLYHRLFHIGGHAIQKVFVMQAADGAYEPVRVPLLSPSGHWWDGIMAYPVDWLMPLYILVATLLLLLHLFQLLRICALIRQGQRKWDGRYCYVYSERFEKPFSFLHYIFLHPSAYSGEALQHILLHERAHAAQRHTWDTLFASFYCCLFWCNPFAWLTRRALLLNLEYLADEAVLQQQAGSRQYQYNLLQIGLLNSPHIVVNSFNRSFIKNRITMMNQSPSPSRRKWKYLLGLPVAALAVTLLAAGKEPPRVLVPVNLTQTAAPPADTAPRFPGGKEAFSKFLAKHIRYPRTAQEQLVTGVVKVQYTIQPNGALTNIRVVEQPIRSAALGEEVKRVLEIMPAFQAASSAETAVLSVRFKLEGIPDLGQPDLRNAETDVVVVGYPPLKKSS